MLPRSMFSSDAEYEAALRDWFSGQCDSSIYNPRASFLGARGCEPTIAELAVYVAQIRYAEADALLAARNTGGAK